MHCVDIETKLYIKVSVDDVLGFFEGKLLLLHSQVDDRFWKLSFFVKYWHENHIKKYLSGGKKITNYGLTLMLLCFMQHKGYTPLIQYKGEEFNVDYIKGTYAAKTNVGMLSLKEAISSASRLWKSDPSKFNISEAEIFLEFVNFLKNKEADTIFNLPRGAVEPIKAQKLKSFLRIRQFNDFQQEYEHKKLPFLIIEPFDRLSITYVNQQLKVGNTAF